MTNNRIIAIVSGKGGSGKTMFAVTLTQILDSLGKSVLLVDTDVGTGGLTYFMGLTEVENISVGLTSIKIESQGSKATLPKSILQRIKSLENAEFLGVGDFRRFLKMKDVERTGFFEGLGDALQEVGEKYDFTIIDCRGGIDQDSLSVCRLASDIIIVAETDTTSFQATQHLSEVLSDLDISEKIRGFFINKVFDDPSAVARNGTASFKAQFLSAVPFDIEATRTFLVGNLPERQGLFYRQVWSGLSKCLPDDIPSPKFASLQFKDFNGLATSDKESSYGGALISFAAIAVSTIAFMYYYFDLPGNLTLPLILTLAVISIISNVEPFRRLFGRAVSVYVSLLRKLFKP